MQKFDIAYRSFEILQSDARVRVRDDSGGHAEGKELSQRGERILLVVYFVLRSAVVHAGNRFGKTILTQTIGWR